MYDGDGLMLPRNTYVVLEIPPPFAERVLEVRQRERDFFRWSLVAETTVSGSGGTGPLLTHVDPIRVYEILDQIAARTAPITTSFGPPRRFPNSDVFYLSFSDEAPLRSLHDRIATSDLRFSPVPFAFVPHVTLRGRSPVSDAEATNVLATRLPGDFTLETLSLYQLVWREPPSDRFETLLCLLHQVRLTGPSQERAAEWTVDDKARPTAKSSGSAPS